MAQRRQASHRLSVEEVLAEAKVRFPDIEYAGEDWGDYVARSRAQRDRRHAFAAEHGYTPLDLFYAEFFPRPGSRDR